MVDLATLAQQLAYYQAGGKSEGQSDLEKVNTLGNTIGQSAADIDSIIKERLAIKKAQQESAPIYESEPSLPQNPADVQKQEALSGTAMNNYKAAMQSFPQLQRDTVGTAPEPVQPTPYVNPYRQYQQRTGTNPLLTVGQNKDIASLAATKAATENKTVGTNLVRQKIDLGQMVYMSSKDGSISDIKDDEHTIPLQKGQAGVQATKVAMQNNKNTAQDASVDAAAKSVIGGNAALSQFPGFGAQSMKGQVIRRVLEIQPDFDFRRNEANFSALKTYANYINSGPYQNTIKYLESVGPNLQQVLDLSGKISRTQFPLINRGVLESMRQTGDPDVVAYAAAVTEVGDQIAKILQGGGTGSPTSDAKIKQASELLNGSYTPEQLTAVAGTLGSMLENRRAALENETVKQVGGQKSAAPRPTGPPIKQKSNDPLGIR